MTNTAGTRKTAQEHEKALGARDASCPSMGTAMAEIILWLLVLNLGLSFRAGAHHEHRIVLPRWLDAQGMHWFSESATGQRGAALGSLRGTGPLTLLTLAGG